MEQRNREVFLKLIKTLKKYNRDLNMKDFLSISIEAKNYHKQINNCGTSACIAGLIPLADKEFARDYIDWKGYYNFTKMSQDLVENSADGWDYIFKSTWGNNVEEAIKRIETYLKTGSAPDEFLFYNE